MDERTEQTGTGSRQTTAAAAPASPRLRLEVELLSVVAEPPPLPAETEAGTQPARATVLLGVAEAELRGYIAGCLREHGELRVLEPGAGETALAALRRLRPALLIAEPALLAGGEAQPPEPLLPPVPLLLLVEEATHEEAMLDSVVRRWATPLAVVAQPFNARRLLDAVGRLLG